MKDQLIALAIKEAPAAIELIRQAFITANPGVPPPTSEEIIAAYQVALDSTLAKDDAYLAIHPDPPPPQA